MIFLSVLLSLLHTLSTCCEEGIGLVSGAQPCSWYLALRTIKPRPQLQGVMGSYSSCITYGWVILGKWFLYRTEMMAVLTLCSHCADYVKQLLLRGQRGGLGPKCGTLECLAGEPELSSTGMGSHGTFLRQ